MNTRSTTTYFLVNHPLWIETAYAVRVLSEAAALRDRGIQVGFIQIVSPRWWRDPRRKAQSRRLRAEGVPVIDLLQPPDRALSFFRYLQTTALRALVRRTARRHGVRLLHAEGIRAGSLTTTTPTTTKVVLDVHGDVEAEAQMAFDGREGTRRANWARSDTTVALERADAVISVSAQMTSWLRSTYVDQTADVTVLEIPCGVDVSRFRLATKREPGFQILYLGGLQAYQPPDLIAAACLDLATLIPDASFSVVTPSEHDRVRAAFHAVGLSVTVRGATASEVPSLMGDADLGIVPRVDDQVNRVACPTKIGEYLAAGVPVACSAYVGGWASWLSDREVGFALQAPPDEIRASIAEIRADRAAAAARCRLVAEEQWAWSRLADRLIAIYDDLETE